MLSVQKIQYECKKFKEFLLNGFNNEISKFLKIKPDIINQNITDDLPLIFDLISIEEPYKILVLLQYLDNYKIIIKNKIFKGYTLLHMVLLSKMEPSVKYKIINILITHYDHINYSTNILVDPILHTFFVQDIIAFNIILNKYKNIDFSVVDGNNNTIVHIIAMNMNIYNKFKFVNFINYILKKNHNISAFCNNHGQTYLDCMTFDNTKKIELDNMLFENVDDNSFKEDDNDWVDEILEDIKDNNEKVITNTIEIEESPFDLLKDTLFDKYLEIIYNI